MLVLRRGPSWEVQAPAKLNLLLDILEKRQDGFHELETLMVPIALFDTLTFRAHDDPQIVLECDRGAWSRTAAGEAPQLPAPDENLAVRAVRLLRQHAACSKGGTMRLVKRIPTQAGLGGGSSDAAAALVLANRAWNLNWGREQLAELAAELGSDIPFFVHGQAAVCRGRGEAISPLGQIARLPIVVAKPPEGLATGAVFAGCRPANEPRNSKQVAQALITGRASLLAGRLRNDLQQPAEQLCPELVCLRQRFEQLDFVAHQMSGSGTSYFGICRSPRQARRYATLLRAQGYAQVAATHCLN